MGHTALILGAGIGGIVAAERLKRSAPRGTRVVVVDRAVEHVFPPSLLWVASGARDLAAITRPLQRLQRRGIELHNGTVDEIDLENRIVHIDGTPTQADAIVIALGAATDAASVPGLAETGFDIYSPGGAVAVRHALRQFVGGEIAIVTAEPMYKCPAAPYEMAFLIDHALTRRGLREQTGITIYAAESVPMATAGPAVSEAIIRMLAVRNIGYRPGHSLASVEATSRTLQFGEGNSAQVDMLLYVPVHRPPAPVRDLAVTDSNGWVLVDRETLATEAEGVYAIGDVTSILLPNGRTLPKAGVFAHAQGEIVAHNIAAGWSGKKEFRRFDGHGACFIELGGGKAAEGAGNFYAEPEPDIRITPPGRWPHIKKVLLEKFWLRRWF